jgi:PP-loop superfamily ATP-utilizing enzyme
MHQKNRFDVEAFTVMMKLVPPKGIYPSKLITVAEKLRGKVAPGDHHQAKAVPKVKVLKSTGMARYIQRNMPHIRVPNELISRFQRAPDKSREAINMAEETMEALKERGFHAVLIALMGWEDKLPELVE